MIDSHDVIEAWEQAAQDKGVIAAIHPSGRDGHAAYRASGAAAVRQVLDLADEHCRLPGPWTVLDYGCGDGRVLQAVVKDARVRSADGYDPSPTMARRARDRKVRAVTRVRDLSLIEYDIVICLAVMIHQSPEDGARLIDSLLELAATGGLVIFDIPVRDVPRVRSDWTDVTVWTPKQFHEFTFDAETVVCDKHPGAFSFNDPKTNLHALRKL